MSCRLRWLVSPRASVFHAAESAHRGLPFVEPALAELLKEPVNAIDAELGATGVEADAFWRAVAPRSVEASDYPTLVATALESVGASSAPDGRDADSLIVQRLVEHLDLVESRVREHWPRLDEELRFRERPLREQWESRGPGMLRRLSELTEPNMVPSQCDVVLVHPCLAGGGEAFPEFGLVCFEAVLANPWATLPEPVRLAWLLAQLGGAPISDDRAMDGRALLALATVPAALEAAEHVEWTHSDRQTLELALTTWRVPLPQGLDAPATAQMLDAWRREVRERRLKWRDAVSELDRRFRE